MSVRTQKNRKIKTIVAIHPFGLAGFVSLFAGTAASQ
jgi:hypothetical protein